MEIKEYQFLLEAEQPIAHHSENVGNESIVMRRKVRLEDGTYANVPIITADTMRHGLREAAAYAFLDAAGLLDTESLSRPALRLLFNGGMVTGKGDASAISLDRYREICELCPPLALLGGCCDSRVIPGRMQVEDARLVCREFQPYIAEWAIGESTVLDTCRAHIETVQRVRMDSLLDPGKRKLLTSGEQVEAARQLGTSERGHHDDDALVKQDGKSGMLPRTMETVIQGSRFYWSVTCTCLNELDLATLHTMLAAFLYRPVVGGKKATGHGKMRVLSARDVKVLMPSESMSVVDTTELAKSSADLFREHIRKNREQIASWLNKVAA